MTEENMDTYFVLQYRIKKLVQIQREYFIRFSFV